MESKVQKPAKNVIIYTDGACSGNPGPGGWGAVLRCGEREMELSGYEENTTNNRMEITAAIKALQALKQPCFVELFSDSSYLVNAFLQHWLENWIKRNWVKSNKEPVENIDLWKALYELTKIHTITWHKVKGHADNDYNNRCDKLATSAIKKQTAKK